MNAIAMTLLLVSTLSYFAWSATRRYRQLALGGAPSGLNLDGPSLVERLKQTAIYAFGQKKMPYYRLAGIAHIAIFVGFNVLLLRSIVLWGRGFDANFDLWGVLAHDAPLGILYGFAKDTVAVLVILGASVFLYLRLVKRSQRMTLGAEGVIILGIIVTMMVSDIFYDGAWFVLHSRITGTPLHMSAEWAGSLMAFTMQDMGDGPLRFIAHAGFWTHASLVLIFLNILPFSKHFHIITAIPNVFLGSDRPAGALPNVDDLEGKVERDEAIGIGKVEDLSWKHLLDLYTCTECGRCSDNCPAFTTGKKLSPKHLTLALRDHLYDTEHAFFGSGRSAAEHYGHGGDDATVAPSSRKEEIHTYPRPPADAYFISGTPVDLVPNVVDPDVLWACTTCRACEEQCPVNISYVDKIVGMRRELVMMKGEMPPELQRPFMGMETNGNPWNQSALDRDKWKEGLHVPLLKDHADAEVLYWVGCAASYDQRAQKTARAVAQLLAHAGVDFAILGTEETCTGDPARRAGNEYLFQILAEKNVETMNGYGVDKKTIITACPHCFNTLANEYPDFGGKFDVVHHSDFLNGLIARGKLKPSKPVQGTVVFHDSCYLGRYNDVYESPREVLQAIPGLNLVEVPYWSRSKGLCCGAGGAQMWMEEQNETRVNQKRTLQLLDTGADKVASGCPFCMTMLSDGLKAENKDEEVSQMDIAEFLAQSVDLEGDRADASA